MSDDYEDNMEYHLEGGAPSLKISRKKLKGLAGIDLKNGIVVLRQFSRGYSFLACIPAIKLIKTKNLWKLLDLNTTFLTIV